MSRFSDEKNCLARKRNDNFLDAAWARLDMCLCQIRLLVKVTPTSEKDCSRFMDWLSIKTGGVEESFLLEIIQAWVLEALNMTKLSAPHLEMKLRSEIKDCVLKERCWRASLDEIGFAEV